ncbi:restriction endonuclease [Saliphagus sp. GCM10025308]
MSNEGQTGWDDIDWKTYQKISAGLHALDSEDVEVEHEHDYELNSGGSKEIDVVVWDHSGRYTTTTLIECKFYSEPVEQEIVDSLIGVLDHSDANRGVVIAKSGFQQGAIDR